MFFQAPDGDEKQIHGKSYLQWAKEAVIYARTQCLLGAANNQLDMLRAQAESRDKDLIAKTAEWQKKSNIHTGADLASRVLTEGDIIRAAESAKDLQASNCVGMSCLAYQYLISNHVTPVELINFQDGNHMLVLLGRSSEFAPILNHESGLIIDDCVICDPWANKVYQSVDFEREKYLASAPNAIGEVKKISEEIKIDITTAKKMYALKYVIPMFDYLNGTPRICYRVGHPAFKHNSNL